MTVATPPSYDSQKCPQTLPDVPWGATVVRGGDSLVWADLIQLVAFEMNLSKSPGQMDFVMLTLSNQEIKDTVGPRKTTQSR